MIPISGALWEIGNIASEFVTFANYIVQRGAVSRFTFNGNKGKAL
jgi:hypothetical protein